jgi:sporulation-control protein
VASGEGIHILSVFGKALASLGVGSAKVDTRLAKSQFRQGDLIKGEVFVQGGQVTQRIDEIYLYLIVQYVKDGKQQEYVMEKFRLAEAFDIGLSETKVIPFEFQLPLDTPVTTGGCPVYLKTGLDIKMAKDPKDVDGIEVLPHPLVEKTLQAIENIGFQLVRVDFDFEKYYSQHPFIQEFVFEPIGPFQGFLDQLKAVFYVGDDEIELIMEVDRKAIDLMSSLEEALELNARTIRLTVTEGMVKKEKLENELNRLIKEQI